MRHPHEPHQGRRTDRPLTTVKHPVGDVVYRHHLSGNRDESKDWFEPYFIAKKTPKRVVVYAFMEEGVWFYLDRGKLERIGAVWTRGMRFVTEVPEAARRNTIGYLREQGPRQVLGLPETFTATELKAAYCRKARETHPDKNPGRPEAKVEFQAVLAAYEQLQRAAR